MRSLHESDKDLPLSLTVPMLAFTPLFLLVTSPLILGELPSSIGLMGVLLIVLGTYVLSIKDVREGYLAPFKALIREKGAQMMLFVAVFFSVGANFWKVGIQYDSPLIFITMVYVLSSSLLFLLMLMNSKNSKRVVGIVHLRRLFLIGLFNALMEIFAMKAMQLGIVPYVISIKRTSILFSTLYGYLFFKEKRMTERLTGAFMMFLGVLVISLS